MDSQDCERCRCVDPCRTQICPDNTKCAITLVATKDGTEYKGVCRSGSYKIKFLLLFMIFYYSIFFKKIFQLPPLVILILIIKYLLLILKNANMLYRYNAI